MKKIIGSFILFLIAGNVIAQEINQKNVPAVVLNTFQLEFPNATDMKWKLEKGNYYVDFEVNNKDNQLVISNKGTILQHFQDLYESEIPKAVLETIKSRVKFFDVSDADRLEELSKTSYRIILKNNENTHSFQIDETGKLLKYTKDLNKNEVPAPVITYIKSKYGSIDIDDAVYEEESGKKSYLLEGEINDMDHTFIFDDKASLLKHEQDLKKSEVPLPVMNAVKAAYVGFEIRDTELTEEGGKTVYSLQLRKSDEKITLKLSPDGKIISTKKD